WLGLLRLLWRRLQKMVEAVPHGGPLLQALENAGQSRAPTGQSTVATNKDTRPPTIPGANEKIPGGVFYPGVQMDLSGKPWEVLKAFVESRLKRQSCQQLLAAIWSESEYASEQNVKDAISEVRTALKQASRKAGMRKPKDPLPCVDKGRNL